MSLKDRIRSRKEAKIAADNTNCEFNISVKKVIQAIEKIENPADLGNIVKEFSKFLNTLSTENTTITFRGNFDLGQRTLLNCILANFANTTNDFNETGLLSSEEKTTSRLVRKRKSIKAKLEAAAAKEENS